MLQKKLHLASARALLTFHGAMTLQQHGTRHWPMQQAIMLFGLMLTTLSTRERKRSLRHCSKACALAAETPMYCGAPPTQIPRAKAAGLWLTTSALCRSCRKYDGHTGFTSRFYRPCSKPVYR